MQFSPKRSVDEESLRDFQNIDIEKLGNLQVLRLEVRLNNSKVLRRKLAKVGFLFEEGNTITFRDVFDSEIARKLNVYYWKQICKAGRQIYFLQDGSESMLWNIGLISVETQPIFTAESLTVKRLFLQKCLRFEIKKELFR